MARSVATAAVLHRNDETEGREGGREGGVALQQRQSSETRSLDGHDDERSIAIV